MDYRFKASFFNKAGHFTWACLLLLSILFWKERAFFMDAGFQLFNLVNEGQIQVYHFRFVTIVPQLLPWLLLQVHAPLWLLGLSFSAAYLLCYTSVWYLLVKQLQNERMGWVLTALFTFTSLDSFYHIQSELYLGLSLLLLLFGYLLQKPALHGWRFWMPALVLLTVE